VPLLCFTFPHSLNHCFTLPHNFWHEPGSTCILCNLLLIHNPCTGLCLTSHQPVFKRQHSSVGQLQPDNCLDLVYIIFYLLELAKLFSIANYSSKSCFWVSSERRLIWDTIIEEQDLSQMKNTFFISQIYCWHGGATSKWFLLGKH